MAGERGSRGGRGRGGGGARGRGRGGRGGASTPSRGGGATGRQAAGGSSSAARAQKRGSSSSTSGRGGGGGGVRRSGLVLVDDTMAADDDYDDDIGEYDEQQPAQRSSSTEQSQRSTQQQQPLPSSRAAVLPPSVAGVRPMVLTGSAVSTGGQRKGRTGRDEVDVGALTLEAMAELDRGIEAERQQRQAAAQRLAEERAAQWQADSMLSRLLPSASWGQQQHLQQQQQQRSSPTSFTSVRRGGKAAAGAVSAAMRGGGNHEAKLVSLHEAYRLQARERVGLGAAQAVAVRRSVGVSGKRKAGELMSSTLLDGSSRDSLSAKLAASSSLTTAAAWQPSPQPQPARTAAPSPPPRLPSSTPVQPASASTSVLSPHNPSATPLSASMASTAPPAGAAAAAAKPGAASAAPTLLLGDEILAVRKEKARMEKQEKLRRKAEKKTEKKLAKDARREQKKVEKAAQQLLLEQAEAEKQRPAEATSPAAATTPASPPPPQPAAAAGSAGEQGVHVFAVPHSAVSIVSELSSVLQQSAGELDEQFETLLRAAEPARESSSALAAGQSAFPPPAAIHETDVLRPMSSLTLTAADEERSRRIDYAKLDAAVLPPALANAALAEQKQTETTEEEEAAATGSSLAAHRDAEDSDFERYELQQRAGRRVDDDADDGEYQSIGGDDALDAAEDEDEERAVAATGPEAEGVAADIAALQLQDLTEEEIIAALVADYDAKERKEAQSYDDLLEDVSAATMAESMPARLLDGGEEAEKEARRRRRELATKRAEDAANGVLDWTGYETWVLEDDSDDDDDEDDSEEKEEEEEEEELSDWEEAAASSQQLNAGLRGDVVYDSDDSEIAALDSTAARRGSAAASPGSCTCFQSGSSTDPAFVARQIEGFLASPLSSLCFPPTSNSLHRAHIHRIAAQCGLSSSSTGEGAARYTTVTKAATARPADAGRLTRLIASLTAQSAALTASCPTHHPATASARPEAEDGSSGKRERKKARELALALNARRKQEKLLRKMEKMREKLRAKARGNKKSRQQQQQAATEAGSGKEGKGGKGAGSGDAAVSSRTARSLAVLSVASSRPIPASNTGHRLLLQLGWRGGGLGRNGDGIALPIAATYKLNSKGLGFSS